MNHANDNTRSVTLPTFHPVRMEAAYVAAEARNNPAKLAASRDAYRAQLRRVAAAMRGEG